MNEIAPTGIGIIGCGNIASRYAADLKHDPSVRIVGVTDLDSAKARTLADEIGQDIRIYDSLTEMLRDETISLIVNLTIHHVHYEITQQCLAAGRHVFSEKPLAMTAAEAWDLVRLAKQHGVRLGAAPMTFLGEAQQTALKLVRDGQIGTPRLCYAEMNHGRIESWHPNPAPFYRVGPLFDVGVYPLMIITAAFGPVRRVHAAGRILRPERVDQEGRRFTVEAPDWVTATLDFESGVTGRLTANFCVEGKNTRQHGIEFHGDTGTVHLDSTFMFDAAVRMGPIGEPMQDIPLTGEPQEGIRWGRGVVEMVAAIRADVPHRAAGEHAAHIVDILEATQQSITTDAPVSIASSFAAPAPMPWAK